MRRSLAIAGFALGLLALIVQFFIIVPAAMPERGPVGAAIYYFSFFTNLTNLLVVLVYLGAIVRGQRWLSLFRRPITRAVAAANIALVGGFYHFFLAGLWPMEGLLYWCTIALHYIAPVLYLVWFALWNRTGTVKWTSVVPMLAYPLGYLIYILIRGALIGEYPYPVLDVAAYGYGQIAINVAGLMVTLLILNALAVGVDRSLLSGRQN